MVTFRRIAPSPSPARYLRLHGQVSASDFTITWSVPLAEEISGGPEDATLFGQRSSRFLWRNFQVQWTRMATNFSRCRVVCAKSLNPMATSLALTQLRHPDSMTLAGMVSTIHMTYERSNMVRKKTKLVYIMPYLKLQMFMAMFVNIIKNMLQANLLVRSADQTHTVFSTFFHHFPLCWAPWQ